MQANVLCLLAVMIGLAACRTGEGQEDDGASSTKVPVGASTQSQALADSLPTLKNAADFYLAAQKVVKKGGVPSSQVNKYAARIARYMAFIGSDANSPKAKNVLLRLMSSSTQFLVCDTPEDWDCLEAAPVIKPTAGYRQDATAGLGKAVELPGTLDFDFYFTEQWDVKTKKIDPTKMLVLKLADKIKKDAIDGLWMALYGIDDINGSIQPVYKALTNKIDQGVPVFGVFDSSGIGTDVTHHPLVYSLFKNSSPNWIFGVLSPEKYNIKFQYGSTVSLIKKMNAKAVSDATTAARLEWPDDGIMHDKFFVFKRGNKSAVWTGTANVAETCMGSERNSNMAIYIRNNAIAEAFMAEFNEMYTFGNGPRKFPNLVNANGGDTVAVGRFHKNKTANTKRLFRFSDGTDVHLHFAPTDDGEHRVILPLLLSARAGDEIRISMFGAGGIEIVRALQLAEARGAHIKIILDRFSGSGIGTWARATEANVMMPNPFKANPPGRLELRMNSWGGLNHHKTATLTRKEVNGMRVEGFIIGSQNWTASGNDSNDENMITMINKKTSLAVGEAYNKHFDERLWTHSVAFVLGSSTVTDGESDTGP